MELIAHRGACFSAPENSLEAFELAIGEGADRLELDVRTSADGTAFVCHDATTERVGDRSLAVRDEAAPQLLQVRLANGESLPTLDDVCRLAAGRASLDVEIKAARPIDLRPVLATLSEHGHLDTALITAFDRALLTGLRSYGFEGRTGLLVGSRSRSPRQRAFEAWPVRGLSQAHATDLVIHHRLAHRPLREWLSRRNLGLVLWMAIEDEEKEAAERAELYRTAAARRPAGLIVGRVSEARRTLGG